MSADDQRAAGDGWTPIPETAACPAECEDCQVTVDRLRAELAETRAAGDALAAAVERLHDVTSREQWARSGGLASQEAFDAWRSVRGDAPAEPPAVELPVTLSSVDDVRERVAEAIAQAIGHRKDDDTPDCSDADSTLGCQHPGGHPQEPGCEDCAAWGWPCSVALTAADAAIEAARGGSR